MKAAIIAAGTGERLIAGGVDIPKPLLPVGGRPLIARIVDAAARLGLSSVACIVNDVKPAVAEYMRSTAWPIPVELTVKTTPSSMESLFCLQPMLRDGPFLLFTVDVVVGFSMLQRFLASATNYPDAAGILALTDFIDDQKPLWVEVDENSRITAMGETAGGSRYVTAGFYYFRPDIFAMVEEARALKLSALRQFLGLLVARGYVLGGLAVGKTVDVDHPEDIHKAEVYLREIDEI